MKREMNLFFLLILILLMGVFAGFAGCSTSESDNNNTPVDGDTADGDDSTDGDTDTVADGDGSEEETTSCPPDHDGCCFTDDHCAEGICWNGVCVLEPTTEATVWWEDTYFDPTAGTDGHGEMVGDYKLISDGSAAMKPVTDCGDALEDVADAGSVTVAGEIKVFGVEAPCQALKVEVYTMYTDAGVIKTSFSDPIATGVVVDPPDEDFRCHLTIENVPVGRWLIFKSYDEGNINFKDTYQNNVYIKPEDKDNSPFPIEINAISNTSWSLVPITAGVNGGIKPGRGAIAGTVKDCDGRLIKNATVGTTIRPTSLAYFNAMPEDLTPQQGLKYTNSDSTWAALDIKPGAIKGVSLAMIDGEIVELANFTMIVVPDAISIMGFRCGNPMNYGEFTAPE